VYLSGAQAGELAQGYVIGAQAGRRFLQFGGACDGLGFGHQGCEHVAAAAAAASVAAVAAVCRLQQAISKGHVAAAALRQRERQDETFLHYLLAGFNLAFVAWGRMPAQVISHSQASGIQMSFLVHFERTAT
jgi:hypothetical protein